MPVIRRKHLLGSLEVLLIHAHHAFERAHDLLEASPAVVSQFVGAGRGVLWQEAEVLQRFEDTTFFEIVVREARFGTAQARVVGPGLARLPVPEDTVAARPGHRPAAAYFVKQASTALAKVPVYFLCEADGIGATILYEISEEGLRAVKVIQENITNTAGSDSYENLRDPVRVCRTARDVDDR